MDEVSFSSSGWTKFLLRVDEVCFSMVTAKLPLHLRDSIISVAKLNPMLNPPDHPELGRIDFLLQCAASEICSAAASREERQHQLFGLGTGFDFSAWRLGIGMVARL